MGPKQEGIKLKSSTPFSRECRGPSPVEHVSCNAGLVSTRVECTAWLESLHHRTTTAVTGWGHFVQNNFFFLCSLPAAPKQLRLQ